MTYEQSSNVIQRKGTFADEVEVLGAATGDADSRDAITGQPLDSNLVRAARKEELEYFASKDVWRRVPRAEALQKQWKPPISVKWVDVNKGDDDAPNYRSRLVAREIRRPWEDSIFSPTPPLEAVRSVLSRVATDVEGHGRHVRDPKSDDRTQVPVT